MKKEKEFEIQSINYALYQARLKKKVSLMEAAINLNIRKLHLSLIEKGYIHVSEKLQPRFIEYYKLDSNFFKNNTTYVTPVEVKYEDPHIDEKIRERIKKKRTKVVSGVISLLLLGILGTGLYYFNREKFNPRAAWSNEFASFRDQFTMHHDDEEASIEFPDDVNYYIEEEIDVASNYKIALPSQDINVTGMYVSFTHRFQDWVTTEITNFVYNQKKVVVFEGNYVDGEIRKVYAISSYSSNRHDYSLPLITLTTDEGDKDFGPETIEYQRFESIFLKDNAIVDQMIGGVDEKLSARGFNYKFDSLMNDAQVASAYKVSSFRLGFRLLLMPSILLAFSLSVFIYALIKGRKIKPKKKKERAYIVHKSEYTADAALVYRSVPNDTTFPMVIPECGLRILALAILFLSSFGTIWLTRIILTGQESMKALNFNAYVSNILVAGLTLAFFLKLDVYHKKTNRELLENILTLFVFGLLFYVAECIIYACLSSQGTIYSEILKLLRGLIPGNIIWNLMLYSLIFLFLFTIPKNIEDTPHKVLLWRLGSVIPTLLLLAAFVVKGTFQGTLSPYVEFLFHTNGVLLTAFAIFYLYSLFFFQQYVSLKYGKDFTKVFLDSRRYALAKNIIACIVIFVLALIDLLFYFKAPFNGLNLGNNWIIAILIPFILFYHPHIGKRLPKWDLAYTVMYVLFLVGGFVIAIGMLSNALDLKQIAEIIG